MSLSLTEVFSLIGLLITLFLAIWGLARWVDAKIDKAEGRLDARVDDCHSRINDTRAEMVGKGELTRMLQMFTDAVQELRAEIRAVNTRIDKLLERAGRALGQGGD